MEAFSSPRHENTAHRTSHGTDSGELDLSKLALTEQAPSRASGWKAGALLALAGLPFMSGEVQAADREPLPGKTRMADPSPNGNLFVSVEQILSFADQGLLSKNVREVESRFSGHFRYSFEATERLPMLDVDKLPALPFGRAPAVKAMEFVATSAAERDRLLKGLNERGFAVHTSISQDITVNVPPSSARPAAQEQSWAPDLMSGLMLAMFGVMAYVAYRSYKLQQRMAGEGGGGRGAGNDYAEMGAGPGNALHERPKQRFEDVGGCPEVIADLTELKQDVQAVLKGSKTVELPRGFLFCGPPGVGKTLIARALAGECEVPFIHVDSSQSGATIFVGTGAMKVSKTWDAARFARDQHTKQLRAVEGASGEEEGICIIFYDEFDSIGSKRTSNEYGFGGDQEHKKVVNTLLNQMDGLDASKNRNIIVIAATNFATDLDPALLRPGRFSKKIEISEPHSLDQRLDILRKLSRRIVSDKGCSFQDSKALEYVAKITPGKTGDQLRDILTQAVDIGRRAERKELTTEDLFEAYQRQSFGRAKPNLLPPDKHELVIRHEHGHALCALACGIDLFLISAIPRGATGGRVVIDPEGIPEILATKKDMLKSILLSSGGRAAELESYGSNGITSGAGMDLQQIRGMVIHMINQGLIEGMYGEQPINVRPDLWKEEHRALINDIATQAIQVAREIVSTIGEERTIQIVTDFKTLDRELVGPEAQKFYEDRLGTGVMTRLQQIAQSFFANPTGKAPKQP